MAKCAVIDVGTNSIKLFIAEKNVKAKWSTVLDVAEISRLGEDLQMSSELTPKAIERNIETIAEMMNTTREQGVKQVVAVGTMCLRTAKNARDFVWRVKRECGIPIEIIPGEEEARLAYLAVQSGLDLKKGKVMIFDTGGGSTEFIFGKDGEMERCFSLNVGAIRYTEDILVSDPVTQEELNQTVAAIEDDLTDLHFDETIDTLVGIGGVITNLSAVKYQLAVYDPDIIQGSKLGLTEIDRQITLYQSKTLEERKKIVGLQPKRADAILAGAAIIQVIMEKADVDSIIVSDRGLRHGVMFDRFNC
jgi:exopolyphosphatase/guanosine-5'-triphosphate,3'-diphosphate pyrophosphatase